MSLQTFQTIQEYDDLKRWLQSLKDRGKTSDWADAIRWYCENDLFFLASEVISDGRVLNHATGKPLYYDQFYVDWCRSIEWQIANGGGSDHSARGSGKSTLRTKCISIQQMIRHPRATIGLFSFMRKHAKKHYRGVKEELEGNVLLRTIFDDRFYWDPRAEGKSGNVIWSSDDGFRIKGSNRQNLTMEYHAFMDGTPVGGRYDILLFDDIEDHRSVGNEAMLEKLHATYDATLLLATPVAVEQPLILFTNTFYSDIGLANRVARGYMDIDERHVRMMPGEDLTKPGDGPLGGTPVYPFDRDRLFFFYEKIRDKREYAIQICCNFMAGEDRRFHSEWLPYYPGTPDQQGRGKNVYICIDPSRGVTDPMVIWVWGLGPDKKAFWLDASVKRLDPAMPAFYEEILLMVAKWMKIGKRIVEIRVENFGQSTYASQVQKYLNDYGYYIPVIPCADNVRTGKFSTGKRDREWERWTPPASQGDVLIPRPIYEGGPGILRADESGKVQDLVEYFLKYEWSKFPKPITDNMLDAGSLLWEPPEKIGRELQYPTASISSAVRSAFRRGGASAMSMG